jgi:LEA14-like dessication related protein
MKKIILLSIIALIIINLIITISLFISLISLSTPDITANIYVIYLDENELKLETIIDIKNTNHYPITINDLKVEITSKSNEKIGTIAFQEMIIQSNENNTFSSIDSLHITSDKIDELYSIITADFEINFLGIFTKTLPINITVIASAEDIIESIIAPYIIINANLNDFNEQGILFKGSLSINNPNNFTIYLTDLDIQMSHTNASDLGDLEISDVTINPHEIIKVNIDGIIHYNALNQGILNTTLHGKAGAKIAGLNTSITFSTTSTFIMPDFGSFLLNNDKLEITLSGDFDFTLAGIDTWIAVTLKNPTNIPMTAYNLTLYVYRVTSDGKELIDTDYEAESPIPQQSTTTLQSNISVPYREFLPKPGESGFPEWFELSLVGHIVIGNSTQEIPLAVNARLSPKIFGD